MQYRKDGPGVGWLPQLTVPFNMRSNRCGLVVLIGMLLIQGKGRVTKMTSNLEREAVDQGANLYDQRRDYV